MKGVEQKPMRRILLVLTVAAITATMMVLSAVPAFAQLGTEVKDDKTETTTPVSSFEFKDDKSEIEVPLLSREVKDDKIETENRLTGVTTECKEGEFGNLVCESS